MNQQEEAGWSVKTTKKRSPVKVGGQYAFTQQAPAYHQVEHHQVARQPEVHVQMPNNPALDMFLERAAYNDHMRAREVGLKALERARPEKPLHELSSTDFMMWKRKFKDAEKHEGLTQMDILLELPKWFAGPAKEIIETATIGATEATAREEIDDAFTKMDVVFMARRCNIAALFNEIVAEAKIQSADHARHFNLSARLQKAKKIAKTCGEVQQCYRDELLQEILNKRVPHLADKFWEKQHEAAQNGQLFSFDNLVNMIETWAVIQRNKGVSCKTASVAAVATTEKEAPSSYEDALTNGKQKMQSTDRCNVCSGMHPTEECHQLLELEVDARVQKIMSRRLCFHCLAPGHNAKGCANRPTCQTCKKRHATILHGRTYKKEDKEEKKGENKQGNKVPLAPFKKPEDAAAAAPTAPSTAGAADPTEVISPNATA